VTRRKHVRPRATTTRPHGASAASLGGQRSADGSSTAPTDAGDRRAAARALFDPRELKKLVGLMEESGLVELEIESAGEKIRLVRANHSEPDTAVRTLPRGVGRETEDLAGEAAVSEQAITSPMVGTFHRAPAPGQPPFVELGDVVERGQVLCLIEAMKMMNEIEAEFRGRVKQILLEHGKPVEFGEALFLIEPL
jgi:acetyl-CoA carboxylase biotin carboxyl carrier protein